MRIRGTILNPRADGSIELLEDGLLVGNDAGTIEFAGPYSPAIYAEIPSSRGIICPAFFDNHIHIPQHPVRGKFTDGVGEHPPEGRLIAGLNRNIFPAEGQCADESYARNVVAEFARDTLTKGVIGGAAYMTVHPRAARAALEMLPATWQVGPVLMNMNCPEYLRTDPARWHADFESLARDFGRRMIVTDRFAVSVDSQLRRAAVALSRRFDLRMQTHLNEQLAEKFFVERTLYPSSDSYTGVYRDDGLLDRSPILAHCIWMTDAELEIVASQGGVIAHCPTSNTLLGSGIMNLDRVRAAGINYAICTDVGASPTTSLLCEMAQFLKTHHRRSASATPGAALFGVTLAAARMLGLGARYGSFEKGKSLTFVEIDPADAPHARGASADQVIEAMLGNPSADESLIQAFDQLARGKLDVGPALSLLERDVAELGRNLNDKVLRTVVDGRVVFDRNAPDA